MKKIIPILICLVLLAGIAFADLCEDSDDGKDYDRPGEVKYGITTQEDRCVFGPNAEVRTETSQYVMEYFCDKSDQRQSEVVDCIRKGFERCYKGACVGGDSSGDSNDSTSTSLPDLPICGDKKRNTPSEECDPPGKICYTASFAAGICDDDCKCDVKLENVVRPDDEEYNETEENETEEPEETPEITPDEPETPEEQETVEPPVDIEPEPTVPEKITEKSKPKGFFSRIWSWFAGLFS